MLHISILTIVPDLGFDFVAKVLFVGGAAYVLGVPAAAGLAVNQGLQYALAACLGGTMYSLSLPSVALIKTTALFAGGYTSYYVTT